jgi:hypothetical protein
MMMMMMMMTVVVMVMQEEEKEEKSTVRCQVFMAVNFLVCESSWGFPVFQRNLLLPG